jgi:hypothetical protein
MRTFVRIPRSLEYLTELTYEESESSNQVFHTYMYVGQLISEEILYQ